MANRIGSTAGNAPAQPVSPRIGIVCARGIGPERGGRADNEDNYLVCDALGARWLDGDGERREPTRGEGLLAAVCDGMGGHADGRVASTAAVRVMAKLHRPGLPKDPARALLAYIQDAHAQLHARANGAGPVSMGTTLTVCWVIGRRASWAHVGDSRLYALRQGHLVQVTADHTRNEFARRDGRPPSEGDHLVQTFIYGSRGLGDDAALRLEAGLDCGTEDVQPGDVLLLCSDGLTSVVDGYAIEQLLALPDPQDAADALLQLALDRGSTDNVTAIVIHVGDPDGAPDVEPWAEDTEETEETVA